MVKWDVDDNGYSYRFGISISESKCHYYETALTHSHCKPLTSARSTNEAWGRAKYARPLVNCNKTRLRRVCPGT